LAGYDVRAGSGGYGEWAAFVGPVNANAEVDALAASGKNFMDGFTIAFDVDKGRFGFISKV